MKMIQKYLTDFLGSECTRPVSFNRGRLLLHVNASTCSSMRDAWSSRSDAASTIQRRCESMPLSQFTGSFAILPLPGRPRMIRATPIVPIPDALVSQTRVWPEILKGSVFILSRWDISRTRKNHSRLTFCTSWSILCVCDFVLWNVKWNVIWVILQIHLSNYIL